MRGNGLRGWLWFCAAAFVVLAVGGLLFVVFDSNEMVDLATYGAFAISLVVLAAGVARWVWRRARTDPGADAADNGGLERAADRLAVAVQAQWEAAAAGRGLAGPDPVEVMWSRPSLPLAGPLASAASSRRFDPLPGLAPVSEDRLFAGRVSDLHAVYGGLGSGRLIVAGPPGSGKSGSAVLLILAALRHRAQARVRDRAKIPVPVLVTAQDWDPRRQPVADWVAGRLQETYPLFTGPAGRAAARTLIAAGKIAVILDGLDEIAAGLRPAALQALSQQASFRVVVLTRTAEMASAASQQGILQGAAAIELRPVSAAEAAGYLERVRLDPAPPGWGDLIDRIRTDPASPLSSALRSPLTLTLVRDTYQDDDARDLLRFCGTLHSIPGHEATGQIISHLLDRVLPAAYARQPGQPPPRYDLPAARSALIKIAACMNKDGTRDLQWWRIPTWPPRTPRAVRALRAGIVAALGFGLLAGFSSTRPGLKAGLLFGFLFGFLIGLMFLLVGGEKDGAQYSDLPRRIGRLRLRKVRASGLLPNAFAYVLSFMLGAWLTGGLGVTGAAVSRKGSRDRLRAGSPTPLLTIPTAPPRGARSPHGTTD